MAFIIDTGAPEQVGPARHVPDWFVDLFPETATEGEVARGFAEHMVGAITAPAKTETVRRHLIGVWPFLRDLAAADPTAFDWIITAYADRVFADACKPAPGGTGQSAA